MIRTTTIRRVRGNVTQLLVQVMCAAWLDLIRGRGPRFHEMPLCETSNHILGPAK